MRATCILQFVHCSLILAFCQCTDWVSINGTKCRCSRLIPNGCTDWASINEAKCRCNMSYQSLELGCTDWVSINGAKRRCIDSRVSMEGTGFCHLAINSVQGNAAAWTKSPLRRQNFWLSGSVASSRRELDKENRWLREGYNFGLFLWTNNRPIQLNSDILILQGRTKAFPSIETLVPLVLGKLLMLKTDLEYDKRPFLFYSVHRLNM